MDYSWIDKAPEQYRSLTAAGAWLDMVFTPEGPTECDEFRWIQMIDGSTPVINFFHKRYKTNRTGAFIDPPQRGKSDPYYWTDKQASEIRNRFFDGIKTNPFRAGLSPVVIEPREAAEIFGWSANFLVGKAEVNLETFLVCKRNNKPDILLAGVTWGFRWYYTGLVDPVKERPLSETAQTDLTPRTKILLPLQFHSRPSAKFMSVLGAEYPGYKFMTARQLVRGPEFLPHP